jgi:hypothetical protein
MAQQRVGNPLVELVNNPPICTYKRNIVSSSLTAGLVTCLYIDDPTFISRCTSPHTWRTRTSSI